VAGPGVTANRGAGMAPSPGYRRVALRGTGIRLADGALHPYGATRFHNINLTPDPRDPVPVPVDRVPGLSIYGGIVGPDFGHVVTQSLGRLWAGELAPEAPLLFLPETADMTDLPPYLADLARGLGVKNDLRLIRAFTPKPARWSMSAAAGWGPAMAAS
jgi:hypothetical protein